MTVLRVWFLRGEFIIQMAQVLKSPLAFSLVHSLLPICCFKKRILQILVNKLFAAVLDFVVSELHFSVIVFFDFGRRSLPRALAFSRRVLLLSLLSCGYLLDPLVTHHVLDSVELNVYLAIATAFRCTTPWVGSGRGGSS